METSDPNEPPNLLIVGKIAMLLPDGFELGISVSTWEEWDPEPSEYYSEYYWLIEIRNTRNRKSRLLADINNLEAIKIIIESIK